MTDTIQKSALHIRKVDEETKRKITAYAKENGLLMGTALKVLVEKGLVADTTAAMSAHRTTKA